jgi:hypothetical protein
MRALWGKPLAGLALLLPLAGCGAYDPDLGSGPKYEADLSACQKSASVEADTIAKRRFYTFVGYPVSTRIFARRAVRTCLAQKGYKS